MKDGQYEMTFSTKISVTSVFWLMWSHVNFVILRDLPKISYSWNNYGAISNHNCHDAPKNLSGYISVQDHKILSMSMNINLS